MAEKLFTAKEAAIAVLKKAEDLLKSAELAKTSVYDQKGVHKPPLNDLKGGTSVMGSHVRNPTTTGSGSKEMARRHSALNLKELKGMPKPDLGKAEMEKCGSMSKADQTPPDGVEKDANPAAPDANMNGNPAPGAFPQNEKPYAAELKGHLKLAKFMGHMESKRKPKAAAPAPAAAPSKPKLPG